MAKRIRFQGREDLLLFEGGSIATRKDYEAGRVSYAHLFDDGNVMRFGTKIGEKSDIDEIGEVETGDPDLARMLFDPSWTEGEHDMSGPDGPEGDGPDGYRMTQADVEAEAEK